MKKKHSFFWSVLIILIAAGAVTCLGWVQLYVPNGQYGVLTSKTSGVFDTAITGGTFTWKWELIFPTNAEVLTFSAKPRDFTNTVSGTLPSAELYCKMLDGNPDFSYSFTVSCSLRHKPDALPGLVEKGLVTGEADLYDTLEAKSRLVTDAVVQYLLSETEKAGESVIRLTTDTESLVRELQQQDAFTGIEITSVTVDSYRIPDTALYALARESYTQYQSMLQERMKATATDKAAAATENFFDYEQLSRLGELFTKNPALLEYCTTLADKGIYYGVPGTSIQ
ncbi:MAG: hypothetical protein MJ178_02305 [Treponemataceae bacterium]|nr:hypothetical protein [Treponemataceae bacterium]